MTDLKRLTEEEFSLFKNYFEGAEMFPDAEAWVDNIKKGLSQIKPQWTKEDVDNFVDAYFDNDPIVNAVLEASKIKLSILE